MSKIIRFPFELEVSDLPLSRRISFLEVVDNEKLLHDYIWQEAFREFHGGEYPSDVAKNHPDDERFFWVFGDCIVEFPGMYFDSIRRQFESDKSRYLETGELPAE